MPTSPTTPSISLIQRGWRALCWGNVAWDIYDFALGGCPSLAANASQNGDYLEYAGYTALATAYGVASYFTFSSATAAENIGKVTTNGITPRVSIIENAVLGKPRVGSTTKIDPLHSFPNIVDHYAGDATKFIIPSKGPGGTITHQADLYQFSGSLNNRQGIFGWIVDQGQATYRRFIIEEKITGIPNHSPKKP